MSAAGRAISRALARVDDWEALSAHRIRHKPSGIELLAGCGPFSFDTCSVAGHLHSAARSLGRLERLWLYWKARRILKVHRLYIRLLVLDLLRRGPGSQRRNGLNPWGPASPTTPREPTA